jgi:hypothetical protein
LTWSTCHCEERSDAANPPWARPHEIASLRSQ